LRAACSLPAEFPNQRHHRSCPLVLVLFCLVLLGPSRQSKTHWLATRNADKQVIRAADCCRPQIVAVWAPIWSLFELLLMPPTRKCTHVAIVPLWVDKKGAEMRQNIIPNTGPKQWRPSEASHCGANCPCCTATHLVLERKMEMVAQRKPPLAHSSPAHSRRPIAQQGDKQSAQIGRLIHHLQPVCLCPLLQRELNASRWAALFICGQKLRGNTFSRISSGIFPRFSLFSAIPPLLHCLRLS